mmetsp:Transcript_50063/g.106505  ORF Transcript_50063/g.106505 Transcript_50063/m.106505 type:complete len:137 (-) Transcript_50063:22-432(-)
MARPEPRTAETEGARCGERGRERDGLQCWQHQKCQKSTLASVCRQRLGEHDVGLAKEDSGEPYFNQYGCYQQPLRIRTREQPVSPTCFDIAPWLSHLIGFLGVERWAPTLYRNGKRACTTSMLTTSWRKHVPLCLL